MRNIYLFVAFITLITSPVMAQISTFALWESTIPGTINATGYSENEVFKDGILQSTSKVIVPTLTVYRPDAGNRNGTAILIFPGGGYAHLAMDKEGKKVAEWLNSLGITAFVLKYRLPSDLIMEDKSIAPLQDAQHAMRIIRRDAVKWNIDPNKTGVMGFSAGGHLAATLSNRYNEKTYVTNDTTSTRPDFSLLIYPVISMTEEITHKGSKTNLLGENASAETVARFSNELITTSKTSPSFIIHAADDKAVPCENSIAYFLALKKNNVNTAMHIYEKGGHGFGLGIKGVSDLWLTDCIYWLRANGYLTAKE